MIVRQAQFSDIANVVYSMRTADRHEVMAARFVEDDGELVRDLWAGAQFCFALLALCRNDGFPVAIIGGRLRWPGVASIIMIATDDWPKIALAATRWVKRVAIPDIVDPICHRSQCEAWEDNAVSLRWLQALGYRVEGRLEGYGKNREAFLQYARLRREGHES